MTIGLPIPVSFQDSNVIDPVPTFEEITAGCTKPIFGKGFEVKIDNWIWEYTAEDDWTPPDYDDSHTTYKVGDIVWKDCLLTKITANNSTTDPALPEQPEMYGAWDTDINYRNWKNRYFRVSASTKDGWLNKQWHLGNRWYYMFWEARGHGGCGNGGWRWSAKDKLSAGERHHTHYLRSCLKANYSTQFSAGKDIKARIVNWHGRDCGTMEPTIQFQNLIERGGYFYFRTHLNKPIKYQTPVSHASYAFEEILCASSLPGFVRKRMVTAHNPFDGKSYTKAIVDTYDTGGYARWTLLSTSEFDSVTFSKISCDHVNIQFKDLDGNVLSEVNNYKIENEVDMGNPAVEYFSTATVYAHERMPSETVIEIEIYGEEVQIGEILVADSLNAGFTNVSFKNKFRDFSPKEQDQWGNIDYRDGVRVNVHSGTVMFPVVRYDQLNRLMLLIGGNKVVIDGSDAKGNEQPDGRKFFESTMMVGRFTSFELSTREVNKRIGDKAMYNFSVEELV